MNVIACDDCSADDTLGILEDFSNRFSNFQVHKNRANLGVMNNYRKLASVCTGDFVAPNEADDKWISSIRLKLLCKYLQSVPRGACFNGFIVEDTHRRTQYVNETVLDSKYRRLSAFDLIEDNIPASFTNCFYRREVFVELLNRTQDCSGYDWLINTIGAHYYEGMDYYPEILSTYRISASGAWSSLTAAKQAELTECTLASLREQLPGKYAINIDRRLSSLRRTQDA
jgi:glycosyltransferase involved in cell wall biosynthesis